MMWIIKNKLNDKQWRIKDDDLSHAKGAPVSGKVPWLISKSWFELIKKSGGPDNGQTHRQVAVCERLAQASN